MSTDHSRRGMGAEDYCTCDGPWPCSLAAEALDAVRERVAAAMYDGNEAFHAALASDRGQEYRRIDRPSWADTDEYYRALYRARADAALAALGITVTREATHSEWGVRYTAPHPEPGGRYPVPAEALARMLADDPDGRAIAVLREVSYGPWRDAQPSEDGAR